MKIRIKIQGTLVFIALVSSIFLYKFLFPHTKYEGQDEILDILGTLIILSGFFLRIVARGHKADMSVDGRTLITSGPYIFLRNPMYLGTLFIGLGVVLVLFEWWVFLLFAAIFSIIYIPQILKEEKVLHKLFGEEYRKYCINTARFFPSILSLFKTNIREHLFFKWKWVKVELRSLIGVLIVVMAIEIWEDSKLFGPQVLKRELFEFFLIFLLFISVLILFSRKKNEK